jgi:signal transduction histidine kinase
MLTLPHVDAYAVGDVIVGGAFLLLGVATTRTNGRVGALMAATGIAWFAGSVTPAAVLWHRGPLVHLLLAYPTGRLLGWPARVLVGAAYVSAVVPALGLRDDVTLVLVLATLVVAIRVRHGAGGSVRMAGAAALATTCAVLGVLAVAAVLRIVSVHVDALVLWAYDAALVGAAVAMYEGHRRGRLRDAMITGVIVDLGAAGAAGSARDTLARVLGDPSIEVGYVLADTDDYVDDDGRRIALPPVGARRATPLRDGHGPVGVVVHDADVLRDPQIVATVAAIVRIALTNVRSRTAIHSLAAQVAASRARIVAADDAQRSRLAEQLHNGPERRLNRVATLLASGDADLAAQLDAARTGLRELARGVHPQILTTSGLAAAIAELVRDTPVPLVLDVTDRRFPPAIESAVYFLCAEGVTNVVKHAGATTATVRVAGGSERLTAEVVDDGRGDADPASGSGLRGLIDRVEAVGGTLRIDSVRGAGTRLVADLPLPALGAVAATRP